VAFAIDAVVGSLLTYSAPTTQVARILATMWDTIGGEEPPLREKVSVVLMELPLSHRAIHLMLIDLRCLTTVL